jgi:uridine kinase
MPKRPFLIGICGGTCSEKSTFAKKLGKDLKANKKECLVIGLVNFYKSYDKMVSRWHIDYDGPEALDWERLDQVLENIINKKNYTLP